MKKLVAFLLALSCVFGMVGCTDKTNAVDELSIEKQIQSETNTIPDDLLIPAEILCSRYSDGTWGRDGIRYKYWLEITGRLPNTSEDITFVYLSNIETITFEQAWKAAGYSSNSADYFSVEDAVLIETRTH